MKRDALQFYYLDEDHNLVPTSDPVEWSRRVFKNEAERIVQQTGDGNSLVSTVFIGIDHRFVGDGLPLVFETLVFRNGDGEEEERYSSWAEAEEGHKRWVERVFPTTKSDPCSTESSNDK